MLILLLQGDTALISAAHHGHLEVVMKLLEAKADFRYFGRDVSL